jgi:hypothetical protein
MTRSGFPARALLLVPGGDARDIAVFSATPSTAVQEERVAA